MGSRSRQSGNLPKALWQRWQHRTKQPAVDVESLLRELAYVLHLSFRLRQGILEDQKEPATL